MFFVFRYLKKCVIISIISFLYKNKIAINEPKFTFVSFDDIENDNDNQKNVINYKNLDVLCPLLDTEEGKILGIFVHDYIIPNYYITFDEIINLINIPKINTISII